MDVSFPGNLTVITGETGAGKSIFLEALGLALGKRADLAALKNKTKKCIIEAEFEAKGLDLASFFEENDLEAEPTIILRREISADGKSRSFLNDSVVSLNALKTLSERLIDIHSQHQTLLLNHGNFQMEVLDAFAGSLSLFQEYKVEFSKLNKLNSGLKVLQEQEAQARKELDYFQFLFDELEQVDIKPGQLKELEDESATLENAETIKSNLLNASNVINGGDTNLLSALNQVKLSIQGISKYGKNYTEYYERINSAYIELKELAADLEDAEGEVSFDSVKLEEVNSKMDKLNRLLKKHAVTNEEDLLGIKTEIENKLSQFGSLESEIEKSKKEIAKLTASCTKLASELSALRTKAISGIEAQVKVILTDLSMENANFKIELTQLITIGISGFDHVKFLFSANKGGTTGRAAQSSEWRRAIKTHAKLKSLTCNKKTIANNYF